MQFWCKTDIIYEDKFDFNKQTRWSLIRAEIFYAFAGDLCVYRLPDRPIQRRFQETGFRADSYRINYFARRWRFENFFPRFCQPWHNAANSKRRENFPAIGWRGNRRRNESGWFAGQSHQVVRSANFIQRSDSGAWIFLLPGFCNRLCHTPRKSIIGSSHNGTWSRHGSGRIRLRQSQFKSRKSHPARKRRIKDLCFEFESAFTKRQSRQAFLFKTLRHYLCTGEI